MEPIKNGTANGLTGQNGKSTTGTPMTTTPGTGAQRTGGDASTDLAGDAKGLASKVKDQAVKAVDQAKGAVGDQLAEQQKKSAGSIDSVAQALHKTSEDLADNLAGPYVEKVAGALDRMADTVRTTKPREIIAKAERFARQDPLLFIGGAFAIGLVAARFLKSSARAEAEGGMSDEGTQKLLPSGTEIGGAPMGMNRGPYGDH